MKIKEQKSEDEASLELESSETSKKSKSLEIEDSQEETKEEEKIAQSTGSRINVKKIRYKWNT